jgi:flagellar FliJ protein
MRRFRFRLEKFLELRRWKEREREIALAKALGEVLMLEKRIAEIAEQIAASLFGQFRGEDGRDNRIDIEAMARRELYAQRLARERERKQAILVVKKRELEEARAKYLEASKERKVLDKLRERRETEYYEKAVDEEFKEIDDMNTASSTRQGW